MSKEVQVLLVEDNDEDALRMDRVLRTAGLCATCRRVQARAEFERQLRLRPPDLILCDYGLRSFDGFVALDVAQRQCPEVPFIFVTNSGDLQLVIEMIESGAADCVDKRRLAELAQAVLGALREAEEQRRQQRVIEPGAVLRPPARAQPAAPASADRFSSPAPLPLCADCKRLVNENNQWEQIEIYLRRHPEVTVTVSLCPVCAGNRRADLET